MNNKIKEKIEKLLNLSLSDNENEASIALEKALKLMNENNITKDEVYRQNFIQKEFDIKGATLSDWKSDMYSSMCNVSGCIFTWRNNYYNNDTSNTVIKGFITGRERDVENAEYLCSFLIREIEKQEKIKKKQLKDKGYFGSYLSSYIKSFKKGIIKSIFTKIYEQQYKFFTHNKEVGIICLDYESKLEECRKHLLHTTRAKQSKAITNSNAMIDGINTGNNIEINQAVSKQNEIKALK